MTTKATITATTPTTDVLVTWIADPLLILGPNEGTAYPGDIVKKVEATQT
jgi:hypothetical protein